MKQYGQDAAEEAIAMGLQDIPDGKAKANDVMGRAKDEVGQFFERVANWLRSNGFQSAADVFGKVASGEVGAREMRLAGPTCPPPSCALARCRECRCSAFRVKRLSDQQMLYVEEVRTRRRSTFALPYVRYRG
jgi:hypothetical protein